MTDLSQIADRDLVLEIYRRIQGDDEMSRYRNFCYRAAFRPVFVAFDKADVEEANVRMYRVPDWTALAAERDGALEHFPE